MLRYRDFKPSVKKTSSFLGLIEKSDSMDDVLAAANAWIDEQKVTVVNIETVVLPWTGANSRETRSTFGTAEGMQWLQTVRVWYRE
ncbi:MAG: hypothetical protein ACK5TO_16255 [Planctomycetaceae bacterium]|jgi:hypothetical protein